jgi:hypothetical protein
MESIWKVIKKADGETFDVYYKDTKKDLFDVDVEFFSRIKTVNIPELDQQIADEMKRVEDFQSNVERLQLEKEEILKNV